MILRHLLCDPQNGQWRMSNEYFIDDLPQVHNEHQVVHLSWSHAGTEIAIVDVFGQISIYNVFLAINRLTAMRRCTLDQDNLSAVIGLMWVYSDRWVRLEDPVCTVPCVSDSATGILEPAHAKNCRRRLGIQMLAAKTTRPP